MVLIIGILAAIAVPQYQKAVEKSRVAEAVTILNAMDKAQQLCALENGVEQCVMGNFWENSIFEPPAELLNAEGECWDNTRPCFHTKDWEFYSDDLLYACPIKNGALDDDGCWLQISTALGWPLSVRSGECPSSMGIE